MKLPSPPPQIANVLGGPAPDVDVLVRIIATQIRPVVGNRYVHWDRLRHLTPPTGLTHEQWWVGVKMARRNVSEPLPIIAVDGQPFSYALPPSALEMLHHIDQDAAGEIVLSETVVNPQDRGRYLVNSLIEEAITSSQLEGASTTRSVAKDMIRTGRHPRDKSELMILNNWRAMNFLREHADKPLTPDLVLELHRVVAEGTLETPGAAGRLQTSDEIRVEVADPLDGQLLHRPPPADALPARLLELCRFANGETPDGFLHPVIRAILVHFWLAYDHPFEDGNGRTARALFYWCMLRNRYWLAEYLSISRILNRARASYVRSFLYTESDGNDATYFLLSQLRVVVHAIDELKKYLRAKMRSAREIEQLLKRVDLNHRQVALLGHALRNPDSEFSYRSHATSHNVARESARSDLLDLEARGYLRRHKIGRAMYFQPAPDLGRIVAGTTDDPRAGTGG